MPADYEPERKAPSWKPFIVMVAIVSGFLWWNSGNLDRALVNVGLNKNPCIQGIAGTFCGEDAERLCSIQFVKAAPACRELRER